MSGNSDREESKEVVGWDRKETDLFWSNVDHESPDTCWEWRGSLSADGYGVLYHKGQTVYSHRVAYELIYGPIPPGKIICHGCNNRPCCNTNHIYAGTRQDNIEDAKRAGSYKGRITRSKHTWVKQTIDGETRDVLMALAEKMHRTVPEVIKYMAINEMEKRTVGILGCIAQGEDDD